MTDDKKAEEEEEFSETLANSHPIGADEEFSKLLAKRVGNLERDEYLAGYDDGLAKASRETVDTVRGVHWMYVSLISLTFLFFGGMKCTDSISQSVQEARTNRCIEMCEPYRMESCGHKSRTATCRTVEGYIVRTKDD